MKQPRFLLVVLLTVVSFAAALNAQAASRRPRRVLIPQAAAATAPPVTLTETICPQYIYMRYPTYCMFYAIQCNDGHVVGPITWVGPCDTPCPQAPCSCMPGSTHSTPGTFVSPAIDGFAGDLAATTPLPEKSTAKYQLSATESTDVELRHTVLKNVVVKANIGGMSGQTETVFLQLTSFVTAPQHPLDSRVKNQERLGTLLTHVGHQVTHQEKTDAEVGSAQIKLVPGKQKTAVLTFQGDEYLVLLKSR